MKPLTITEFKDALASDALLVDSRPAKVFAEKFIPGSLWLGLEGDLERWAAVFIGREQALVILSEAGREAETAERLQKAGLQSPIGFLNGGIQAWENEAWESDMLITVEADELIMDIPFDENLQVVDLRSSTEFEEGHLKDALNLPLEELENIAEIANFEDHQNLYLHSAHDYRSYIAASLLKRHGIHNLRQVEAGWAAIQQESKAEIIRLQPKKA